MKIKLTKDYNIVLIYILFCLLVFQSGTVQAAIDNDTIMFKSTRLLMIGLALFFGIRGLITIKLDNFKSLFLLVVLLEIIAGINYILYSESWLELQYKIILFLLLLLFIYWCEAKKINYDNILYNVLIVISYITIIMYVLIELLHVPFPYSITHEIGSTVWYRNYFNVFYTYSTSFPPRICGFFWEPGVNQIYLNLALLLYYLLNKKNKIQLTVLIISIVLTQSASGYMIMFIVLAAIIVKNEKILKVNKSSLRAIMVGLAIACASGAFYVKMIETSGAGDSFSMRSNDLVTGLKLFLQSPIIGNGFYNTDIFSEVSIYQGGNSNGLLTVMYTTGIVGMLFLCIPFLLKLLCSKTASSKRQTVITFLFVIAINFTEPIYSLPIMIYLIAREYGIIKIRDDIS